MRAPKRLRAVKERNCVLYALCRRITSDAAFSCVNGRLKVGGRSAVLPAALNRCAVDFPVMQTMSDKPVLPDYLDRISVVLCRTSHPGNIGSAARAMKTMGLHRLVLVSPNLMQTPVTAEPPLFDPLHPEAFRLPEESFILASGATDVLEQARVCATLEEALADTVLSCALTSRKRELTAPLQTPRELTPELLTAAQQGQRAALVFGNETFGLSIEEVGLCNRLMTINGNPDYFSLNLSQAVQVVSYELFSQVGLSMAHLAVEKHTATAAQINGMVQHMESLMEEIGFFNRRNGQRIIRRLHNLFARAGTETEDIDILRGFFNSVAKRLSDR